MVSSMLEGVEGESEITPGGLFLTGREVAEE